MATLAERKEYLENELRSYRYIVDQCYHWEQVIVNAEIAIYGVSSPHAKDVIYENVGDPYDCRYNSLYEDIKKAKAQLLIWRPRRQWIEGRVSGDQVLLYAEAESGLDCRCPENRAENRPAPN